MQHSKTIKINFRGGIISPGELYNILVAASKNGIGDVSFGLRQQLLIDVAEERLHSFTMELKRLMVRFEIGSDVYPNIVSSYPAEEVFIHQTWLSEGVYKDILDLMDFEPRLKINIGDSNQSFTPLLTGNLNWVASATAPHFWHLYVRFPKTNLVFHCPEMVYTNDIARVSMLLERLIYDDTGQFVNNTQVKGESLYRLVPWDDFITQEADKEAALPAFNLPYYEGLNRYNNKYWLGIYRRDELYAVNFLKDLCQLCLKTRIGQLCSTPWKSLIVKSIEEKDRGLWNRLLSKYQINIRHAANELNFQVEDNCKAGLALKHYLVKRLNEDDMRTFGVCIGIKTRQRSEVFSSILIKRKPLLRILGLEMFFVYDILCAKDFNPNERTGFVFSANNPKSLLAEQLRRAIISFYHWQATKQALENTKTSKKQTQPPAESDTRVHQCKHCKTVYEETIPKETRALAFRLLPEDFTCPLCEAPKKDFMQVEQATLGLMAV